MAVALLGALVGGLFFGLLIARRVESGQWEMPDVADVVEVVLPAEPPEPSRIIYLEATPAVVSPGRDDAVNGVSSVVGAHHPSGPVKMPGWKGSKAAWTKVVTCVRKLFAPFDVVVTDQRPAGADFIRVVVGGKPTDLGIKKEKFTGLAPFSGGVIPRAVVFAFSAAMRNDVRGTCETIGMEVAHAYGLDHEYLCKDVMTYLGGCSNRTFVDKDAPCGEKKKRPCAGGGATQNSFQRLRSVLGPRRKAAP